METAANRALAIPELLDIIIGYAQVCCTCSIAAQRGVNKLWNETTLARMAAHLSIEGVRATYRCSRNADLLDATAQPFDQSGLYRHTKSVLICSNASYQFTLSVLGACSALKEMFVDAAGVASWAALLGAPRAIIDSLQIYLGPLEPCANDWSALASMLPDLTSLKISFYSEALGPESAEDDIEDKRWSSFITILQEAPSQLQKLSINTAAASYVPFYVRDVINSSPSRFHHLRTMNIVMPCFTLGAFLDNLPDCVEHLGISSTAAPILDLLTRLARPAFLPQLVEVDITCSRRRRFDVEITEEHLVRAIAGLKQRQRLGRINYDQLHGLIAADNSPHIWDGNMDTGSEDYDDSLQEQDGEDDHENQDQDEDNCARDSGDSSDDEGEQDQKSEESDAESEDDKDPDLYQEALPLVEYEGYYDLELPRADDDESEEERVEDELPESSIELEPEYLDELEDYA